MTHHHHHLGGTPIVAPTVPVAPPAPSAPGYATAAPPSPPPSGPGALPFTGLDAWVLVAVALVALAAGAVTRRAS